MTARAGQATGMVRFVHDRDRELTAVRRCACYAALSELVCSPHDVDSRPALRDRLRDGGTLDAPSGLDELLPQFVDRGLDTLKREYSSLFEIGSEGPPCPIREDLQTGQRKGTREDLVRFYGYFNYLLDEKFAWAPDHLSVELEFMHFLCYREASAGDDAASYQLAQVDFSERHLVRWVPELVTGVTRAAPDSIYRRVIEVVDRYLAADVAWQRGTISAAPDSRDQE